MSNHDSNDEETFNTFLHELILGTYAESYATGWDDCMHGGWKKGKHNPFSNKVYPVEHKAYDHGFNDAIQIISEWERSWRKKN